MGRIVWESDIGEESSVGYMLTEDDDGPIFVLFYRLPNQPDVWTEINFKSTPTNFNGRRLWFSCPMIVDGVPCTTWAPGNKRNACRAIQRAMNWAVKQGYIDRSPIAGFEKPPQGRREQIVIQAEFDAILASTRDREFRDLIITTWETGARPQETLRVAARHVDLKNARWVFPASESKGGRLPRVIYLSTEALEITKRLVLTYSTGPLFRNTRGNPWTADSVSCRFTTLQKKLGTRYSLYAIRHSWATKALQNGVDPITVAVLLGHHDPSMLAKHYQHLSQDPNYLREAVSRAIA